MSKIHFYIWTSFLAIALIVFLVLLLGIFFLFVPGGNEVSSMIFILLAACLILMYFGGKPFYPIIFCATKGQIIKIGSKDSQVEAVVNWININPNGKPGTVHYSVSVKDIPGITHFFDQVITPTSPLGRRFWLNLCWYLGEVKARISK